MLVRLFQKRRTKHSLEFLSSFTKAYLHMKVFTETPRRPRKIQILLMTGNELGVLTLSVFPSLFTDCIKSTASHW
jgi:hypothetical protein